MTTRTLALFFVVLAARPAVRSLRLPGCSEEAQAYCEANATMAAYFLEVYLDPSRERWRAAVEASQRVIAAAEPLHQGSLREDLARSRGILGARRGVREQIALVESQRACAPDAEGPGKRTRLRPATPPPSEPTMTQDPVEPFLCSQEHLTRLVVAGDPIGRTLIANETELHPESRTHLLRWLELMDRYPQAQERLSAALDDLGVRRFALDELLAEADPRAWKPENVALVVFKARAEDHKALTTPEPVIPYWRTDPRPFEVQEASPHRRLSRLLEALEPMGTIRAFDLVDVKSLPRPGTKATAQSQPVGLSEHFPGEYLLYESQWVRLPADARGDLSAWGVTRWFETDEKAPHPDMDAVRKAVRKLEKGSPR